jgi:hypothetical protein
MAAGYLLDTNVVSETRKARADTGVLAFLSAAEADGIYLSVLTLGELHKGVEARRRADPEAASLLGAWIEGIESTFADRILPVDASIARIWGELSSGGSRPVVDTLIAATALRHGLTLVTRNTRDFEAVGVPLLDPWLS